MMARTIKLRKGLQIRMKGNAGPVLKVAPAADFYALKPADFPGLTPRLAVKQGQEIRAGEPLFYDKYTPEILFVSPVGGIVFSVNRGERRKILEVKVKADPAIPPVDFGKGDPLKMDPSQIREQLLNAGMWPFIKRRPYGIIARVDEIPKAIFISCFDTAPLAPDYDFILKGQEHAFQTGINVLSRLTPGKVHLGLTETGGQIFENIGNASVTRYSGPHPAGNVGIQIHHTDPLNKGEVVWTIQPQDVLFIGRLFETGKVDFSRIVALTGSEVSNPSYYSTCLGVNLPVLLAGNLTRENGIRVISGNVLTGTKVISDNFLGFYDSMVTVIPEGDYFEFLGWAKIRPNKFSMSHAYLSWLNPGKIYSPDTNINGEERAFVMTGQYEKVLPMDIMPVLLLKAILSGDIDRMEKLGIYEVIEEDLALCEYVCTSKTEVQDILRKGINLMIRELG